MNHFSISERKDQELEEISEREGRKKYDLVREAISSYLRDHEGTHKTFQSVPGDGVIRSGDHVISIRFDEMWIETLDGETKDVESMVASDTDRGVVVRAIERGSEYFTYYKFIKLDQEFVCQVVAPITHDLLEELVKRI